MIDEIWDVEDDYNYIKHCQSYINELLQNPDRTDKR